MIIGCLNNDYFEFKFKNKIYLITFFLEKNTRLLI